MAERSNRIDKSLMDRLDAERDERLKVTEAENGRKIRSRVERTQTIISCRCCSASFIVDYPKNWSPREFKDRISNLDKSFHRPFETIEL